MYFEALGLLTPPVRHISCKFGLGPGCDRATGPITTLTLVPVVIVIPLRDLDTDPAPGGRGDEPPWEVVEAALAHIVQNEVEAAYGPSDVVERRRQLMDDWFPYVVDGTGSAA